MPRKARIVLPSFPHHVVQRGHNAEKVFFDQRDFSRYLENMRELKEEYPIKVYAWCLMTNHVHLLLEPAEEEALGLFMKRLNGRQTRFANVRHGRSGTLWSGRYHSSPIERDTYLLACCRYVEMNPVRAAMVADPAEYRWSSYRERMEGGTLLDHDPVFLSLGDSDEARRERYRRYLVEEKVPKGEVERIRLASRSNQLTGGPAFVDRVERLTGLRLEPRGRGRPRKR